LDPKLATAHHYLGRCLSRQGKLDEAIAEQRMVLELDANYAAAHSYLGDARWGLGELTGAIASYRKAIELDPRSFRSHINLGCLLNDRLKEHNGAAACFRRAITLDPNSAMAHGNLGTALNDAGKPQEAIAEWRRAIALDPNFAYAYVSLAWLLATSADPKLRDPSQAVELAQQAVKLAPADANNHNTLAIAHYSAGHWKLAIEALQKSIDLKKDANAHDCFYLAMAYHQLGHNQKARASYAKAIASMDRQAPGEIELRRLRAEAAKLLGVPASESVPKKKP
jgi:tetratricopeptide (TPR) repeat protein